ncbi:ShlB/FhaC/HecB family hemolysin secretion/activation protein [Proteus cibi]|uniref:ShlB/FhaC/HecB family hemolysin secretion/activation protein n=1 Tax=Proteus cibi TaxID=2050966 RepID=A0ABU6EDI4_9GAMM|nr:ShlB/FhaC/HecB family hemolysin secretion/activation protein [Proteus cibi]MEB6856725.1 ShlB/FhaC/HecB family hemolysin secretion/activation protein [Proteus cibi]MEB7087281.1 ShlB/FhaC/HecB family hemolysin secretion/activation protein [Proteus cibi]
MFFTLFNIPISSADASEKATEIFNQQQQHNQSQQEALYQQLTPEIPNIYFDISQYEEKENRTKEKRCFTIEHIEITNAEVIPHWVNLALFKSEFIGQCLGINGINTVVTRMQNRLLTHGWITTRIVVPEQDISRGTLYLTIVPGIIRNVQFTDDSDKYALLYTSMPAHKKQLLDLRDIEQGLENLQRLPVVSAEMEIKPGENAGESDIVIKRKQSRFWHTSLWVNDAGSPATGRYQGGLMLALDNPFALSDLFYLSTERDLDFAGNKNNQNMMAHYSVPLGYWLFDINASKYDYSQTVAGHIKDILYSGESDSINAGVSYTLFRNQSSKTTLRYGVQAKVLRNYIDNTEIEIQRRRVSSWLINLSHRQYFSFATFEGSVNYQRGTRWFGSVPAYEEAYLDNYYATDKADILTWRADLEIPILIGQQAFRYQGHYRRQMTHDPLTAIDKLSIGNRWTIRGFDGERTLSANEGWYIQNTLSWQYPSTAHFAYLGIDYGKLTDNTDNPRLLGKHLAGGVIGIKGSLFSSKIKYDTFIGTPLSKPDGFKTDHVNLGFSIHFNY